MTGNEIREAFIRFFESKEHKHVRSSSLVPHNDPTILFINAGMNQFKDYFLGNQVPDFKRAVTSQKIMRAGGKHNDLENVGVTERHHTFFEMLGNFSFGDYFKEEAIQSAWEFLTEVLKLSKEKLAITVYNEDEETFRLWNEGMGIPAEKIGRLGEKDNFWTMGDTGPCGPCTEIHYRISDEPSDLTPAQHLEADDDVYLEIWNLVFMQYNRGEDQKLVPLPNPSIDTGLGFERITAIMQGKNSNYDSDIFVPLLDMIAKRVNHEMGSDREKDISCRVIADHLRASVFLISDGVLPSNEGRGYVIRRIIRRAARHGKQLGFSSGFFSNLVEDFIPMMEDAYPEIRESQNYTELILKQEEQRFSTTLNQGMKMLDEIMEKLKAKGKTAIAGEEIFKLYDTYGFPEDLAHDILTDHGYSYDEEGFRRAMEEQKNRAKNAQEGSKVNVVIKPIYVEMMDKLRGNEFVGYRSLEVDTEILAVLKGNQVAQEIQEGDEVELILAQTPFYAEGGGQIGDTGVVYHDQFRVKISNTQSPTPGLNISQGVIVDMTDPKIVVESSMKARAVVDQEMRGAVELNHTATHLLQAAMRTVLGDHVKQSGSLVNHEKLRFDFSHYAPVTPEQLQDIEAIVNENIRKNDLVTDEVLDFDQAVSSGAMAIFGEKYGDDVRVITTGSSSKELCGGCHTSKTGNIGLFKITLETSIASGIRRVEACTGKRAFEWIQQNQQALDQISSQLKVSYNEVADRVFKLEEQSREKDRQIEQMKKELQQFAAAKSLDQVVKVGDLNLLMLKVDPDTDLKSQADSMRKELKSGLVLLGKIEGGQKISVVLALTKDHLEKFHAGKLIKELSPLIEGRGGGKPDIAQCGGTNPAGWGHLKSKLQELIAQ